MPAFNGELGKLTVRTIPLDTAIGRCHVFTTFATKAT